MGVDTRAAQERFCAAAWPRLVAAVSHYCGDVHIAEEVVQEALIRACGRWPKVSQLSSPEGWTYRVAVNLATSRWRRFQAERRARERHGPERTITHPDPTETQLVVHEALAILTPQQRDAVILRHFLDLSAEQTAEVMGRSAGAIRGLTHRGVQRLRQELASQLPVTEEVNDAP